MKKRMTLTIVAVFTAVMATSALAYQETTTTTTTTDQDGIITSVDYKTTTPWFTVKNAKGVESKIFIDNDKSRGWTRAQKWDGTFVTGTPVRYQYENRNNTWYARNVYIADNDQPSGWSKGKKTGWDGSATPPGYEKNNKK